MTQQLYFHSIYVVLGILRKVEDVHGCFANTVPLYVRHSSIHSFWCLCVQRRRGWRGESCPGTVSHGYQGTTGVIVYCSYLNILVDFP
jgi:hypothetical protein